MIPALLSGKLSRQQENMEDVLTSNVFGLLRYLPANEGLFAFLALAESADRSRPLSQLRSSDSVVSYGDYNFWPYWNDRDDCETCEPDLVISVKNPNGQTLMILIEAKYRSGKSSTSEEGSKEPKDQLAREWHNLQVRARSENADPYLIYLTTHIGYPKAEIDESVSDYQRSHSDPEISSKILALSWRQLSNVFLNHAYPVGKDLFALSQKLGLVYFDGFKPIGKPNELGWKFAKAPFHWEMEAPVNNLTWRFSA